MKKNYIQPCSTCVKIDATQMLATSSIIVDSTNHAENDYAFSEGEDWEDKGYWE